MAVRARDTRHAFISLLERRKSQLKIKTSCADGTFYSDCKSELGVHRALTFECITESSSPTQTTDIIKHKRSSLHLRCNGVEYTAGYSFFFCVSDVGQ